MKRCLIVSGGNVDKPLASASFKKDYELRIAVDGGLSVFYEAKEKPTHILGDFDTVPAEILEQYKKNTDIPVFSHPPQKDSTDTELAIRFALLEGATEILLLGGTGTRMDHTLSNIQGLLQALLAGVPCQMLDPYNRIYLLDTKHCFVKKDMYGPYLSLLPLTGRVTGLTLKGFRYPLTRHTLVLGSSLGISNEVTEEQAELTMEDGVLIVVESRDEPKENETKDETWLSKKDGGN